MALLGSSAQVSAAGLHVPVSFPDKSAAAPPAKSRKASFNDLGNPRQLHDRGQEAVPLGDGDAACRNVEAGSAHGYNDFM